MSSDEEASQGENFLSGKASCSVRSKDSSSRHFSSSRKGHSRSFQRNHLHGFHVKGNVRDHWSMPQTPSPYFMGSKKRQNGDKNEQIAKSKRTCPSGRLFHSELTNSGRKKNGLMEHLDPSHSKVFKEDYDFNNGYPSRQHRGSSFRVLTLNDTDSSPSEMIDQRSENSIPTSSTDGPSSSFGSSSSTTDSNASSFAQSSKQSAFSDVLSRPSTSKFGLPCHENNNSERPLTSKTTRYEESDEDSRSSVNSTSLKGGCQSSAEGIHSSRKVIGRGCRKILESDDSSDNDWLCRYPRPIRFLSTDSDDSSDFPVKPRRKQFSKLSLSRLSSSDSNDDFVSHATSHSPHHSRSSAAVKKPCNSSQNHTLVNNFDTDFLGEHSYATPETSRKKAISSSHSNNNGSSSSSRGRSSHGTPSSPLIGRPRYSRHKGSSRRSISPHPRMMSSRRSTGSVSGAASGPYKSQGGGGSRHRSHLASQFPDLFDAEEDSSEVEFFTARSYSDTETSESVNGVDLNHFNTDQISHRNNSSTIVLSSDEDEVSIIFSSDSPHASVHDRSSCLRGAAQRRLIRGSGCSSLTQAVPSASPDPVEQVRQVEEDEQYARMLQAEFDAEVNALPTFLHLAESDTDSPAIDLPHTMVTVPFPPPENPYPAEHSNNSAAADRIDHNYMGLAVMAQPPPPQVSGLNTGGFSMQVTHPSRRIHRGRTGMPSVSMPDAIRRRRRDRNARSFQFHHGGDPWMWQFARVLGLGPTYSHDETDYETLMNLTEAVGDVIPRGLHKAEISRLPTRKYYSPGSGASTSQACDEIIHKRTDLNKECQVCLCDYENGDLLRILPCFHEFHTPCIDPWLKINHTCPVCRVEVKFDD